MNIAVIGAGYVGLVSGACLADIGMNVICMDTDIEKIKKIEAGYIPIYEPGLDTLVKRNLALGKLKFTSSINEAVAQSTIILIAVNTPTLPDNTSDLQYVFKASADIAHNINEYKVIVTKSTVPIGTGQKIREIIHGILNDSGKNIEFDVVSNPEFLREGTAVKDFLKPDRVVIGVQSERAAALMKEVYSYHESINIPIIVTNIETSEVIKYAANTFLATKISFINEIANICELCGADISIVSKAIGLDKRIGTAFLKPGPGYGGSCLPKDTKAFVGIGEKLGYIPRIVQSVIEVNDNQVTLAVKKVEAALEALENKNITVLGVAFKPETDDIRESPSIKIVKLLLEKNISVSVTDPEALDNMKKQHPELQVSYFIDPYEACMDSDLIVLVTDWEIYKNLDFAYIKSIVKNPVLIDLRNIFNPKYIEGFGIQYIGIGK